MATYEFFAPLANARGNFRSVALAAPFRIERWPKVQIIRLWRQLASLPKFEIEVQAESSQCVPRGSRVGHVAIATLTLSASETEEGWRQAHEQFDHQREKLQHQLRLVSLFLGGHVEPVAAYWYSVEAGKPQMESGVSSTAGLDEMPATVTRHNAEAVNAFLQSTRLPLTPDYVHLALEHWEESHRATRRDFELLSLVMALEALFNVGAQDIRYRVSRSIAVLLGDDSEQSDHIFEAVGKAYEVRSRLVHTGKAKGIENVWLWQLSRLVQQAILRCLELKHAKDTLSSELTRLGFGASKKVTANPVLVPTGRQRRTRSTVPLARGTTPR